LLGGGGEARREKMVSANVVGWLSHSDDNCPELNEYETLFGRGELARSPPSELPESNCEEPCALCRLEGDMVSGRGGRGAPGCRHGVGDSRNGQTSVEWDMKCCKR
jgi:hypothetical protein